MLDWIGFLKARDVLCIALDRADADALFDACLVFAIIPELPCGLLSRRVLPCVRSL